jgi:hypothetical protein
MALRVKLRQTLIRLGRIPFYPRGRASASGTTGCDANEPSHAPKATTIMQTTPLLAAQPDGPQHGSAKRDEILWEDLQVTTEADVEVDSVTPERMERLRDIAARYAPGHPAS